MGPALFKFDEFSDELVEPFVRNDTGEASHGGMLRRQKLASLKIPPHSSHPLAPEAEAEGEEGEPCGGGFWHANWY